MNKLHKYGVRTQNSLLRGRFQFLFKICLAKLYAWYIIDKVRPPFRNNMVYYLSYTHTPKKWYTTAYFLKKIPFFPIINVFILCLVIEIRLVKDGSWSENPRILKCKIPLHCSYFIQLILSVTYLQNIYVK